MQEWIYSLGYLGTYLGAILEGELLFLTAVQAARLGYLSFYGVLAAVYLGTITADWTFYFAGDRQGRKYISRFPKLQHRFARMEIVLAKHTTRLLLFYRFLYGFRVVLPVLFGVSHIPFRRFAVFSLLGTLVWVAVYGALGYYFAELVLMRIRAVQEYGWVFMVVAVLLPSAYLLLAGNVRRLWKKSPPKREAEAKDGPQA